MTNTRLSVIIPTLNESKLIKNVLCQFTLELKEKFRCEVIVSDGKSTDNTVGIAKSYADKICIHNGVNKQNIAEGRNKGAEISFGDVLVFFNADTKINDVDIFFNKILEYIDKFNFVAIAFPIRVFKEEEIITDKLFHGFYNFYVSVLNKFGLGMGRGECHVVKKENFIKAGMYNEKLNAGEDFDLYRRLRKFGNIHYAKELIVRESPRRYRKFGYISVVWDWLKNSVWIILFNKSVSKSWEPVR